MSCQLQTFALKFLVCNIVWREIFVGQDFHGFPSHHKKFSRENIDCENLTTCTTHMRMPHHLCRCLLGWLQQFDSVPEAPEKMPIVIVPDMLRTWTYKSWCL